MSASRHTCSCSDASGNVAPGYPASTAARRRFFIVSAGRTGSTLLSALLADCAANFGLPMIAEWDRGAGAMEHSGMRAASDLMKHAYDIGVGRPAPGYRRLLWNTLRSAGKRRLRRALESADYFKGESLDLVVQPAFKLGYFPSVILSYRSFEDAAVSSFPRRSASTCEALLLEYRRLYRGGLLLLYAFGGCVVGFRQLIDRQDTSWARSLAQITGLDADSLVRARNRRLAPSSRALEAACLDRGTRELFEHMDALHGCAVMPSDQVLRYAGAMVKALSAGRSAARR